MTRNAQALTKLIQELDRNLRLCDGVIAGAHWRLVEDIAGRRARAASIAAASAFSTSPTSSRTRSSMLMPAA